MDVRHNQSVANARTSTNKAGKRKDDASLKVVYISSPMKVRTSAAKFRSLVQELTGKNSDIAQYMDGGGGELIHDHGELPPPKEATGHQMLSSVDAATFDWPPEQFGGMLSSSELYCGASSHWDVLGSYEDLM